MTEHEEKDHHQGTADDGQGGGQGAVRGHCLMLHIRGYQQAQDAVGKHQGGRTLPAADRIDQPVQDHGGQGGQQDQESGCFAPAGSVADGSGKEDDAQKRRKNIEKQSPRKNCQEELFQGLQ